MEQKYTHTHTHTRILGGLSHAFSVLPLKSVETQPRASDESKYSEENSCMRKAELEHEPAWRRCFPCIQHQIPAVKAQRVHRAGGPSFPDVCQSPERSDGLLSAPC